MEKYKTLKRFQEVDYIQKQYVLLLLAYIQIFESVGKLTT